MHIAEYKEFAYFIFLDQEGLENRTWEEAFRPQKVTFSYTGQAVPRNITVERRIEGRL